MSNKYCPKPVYPEFLVSVFLMATYLLAVTDITKERVVANG